MKYVLALCSIAIYSMRLIDTLFCDFGNADEIHVSNAIVGCQMDTGYLRQATVICPHRVNDTDYVWHPQPTVVDHARIDAYVSGNGVFRSVAISDVIVTESSFSFVTIDVRRSDTELQLDFPFNKLFAMTERRLIFICGPRDLVLSDTLQRHLDSLNGFGQMQALPWTSNIPLAHEMSKIGHGIGIFFLYSGSTHLPLQGCGSRPSPLFHADSEVTVDPSLESVHAWWIQCRIHVSGFSARQD
ncbi:hypothetical protein, conserved [Babesia ovata]|uniref:Uncharacterized protein n=1 Tax=Babesia ovata TaxID=189622 RepID=A0A2H6KFP6_9APIC|nr:uncharacterized protein BOVATA_033160 [Babesia ovata]GBE61823.1 hypothetical protein, conserved [Babesia ovata]